MGIVSVRRPSGSNSRLLATTADTSQKGCS
jgi:hypothetical protein